jgi:glutamine synthetase
MKPKSKTRKSAVAAKRGVASIEDAAHWFAKQNIEEIECFVPDMAGVARGKIMPVRKFLNAGNMNLPLSVFYQTITGDFPDLEGLIDWVQSDTDIVLVPDFATLASVPWAQDPTGQVIHDAFHPDGRPVDESPRQVLRRVLSLSRLGLVKSALRMCALAIDRIGKS